jgi:hypothetical protein
MEIVKPVIGRPKGTHKKIIPTRINGKLNRAYSKYRGMLARCLNPRNHNYEWYGGRGITVNESWRGEQGFDNFVRCMGEPPPKMTLGRIDNEKGYGPGNCRWETQKEQCQNRRPGGPPINSNSLRQKALSAGLPYHVVYLRIRRLGWAEERALSTPKNPPGRLVGYRKPD